MHVLHTITKLTMKSVIAHWFAEHILRYLNTTAQW